MKLLVVGDVHGNDRFLTHVIKLARDEECQAIIQVGDFGYWEHYKEGKGFLKWTERQLLEKDIPLYWLDGNHENHTMLRLNYGPGGERHKPTKEGFWKIRENLFYLPRGVRWNWEGVDFMAVGGAYSVDKEWRTEGKSWWPEETITEEDAEYASREGNVDVIFSHDAPDGVDIPSLRMQEKDRFPESRENREVLKGIVHATNPVMLVHGHYHCRYEEVYAWPWGADDGELEWRKTLVEGLGCDMDWDNRAYITFDTRRVLDLK